MTGQPLPTPVYRHQVYSAEPADTFIVQPLGSITLIFQRRSGITHIVADPIPQILAAMGDDLCDAATIAAQMAMQYNLGDPKIAHDIIAARLEELEKLGLVERIDA